MFFEIKFAFLESTHFLSFFFHNAFAVILGDGKYQELAERLVQL